MYNTVGETAGVTQDVGSDPTVGATPPSPPDFDLACLLCCMCKGEILYDEEEEEEGETTEEQEFSEAEAKAKEKAEVGLKIIDWGSMLDREDEGEDDAGLEGGRLQSWRL